MDTKNVFGIITTIYPPTKAVEALSDTGINLIVVGDKKTPNDWCFPNVSYLSPDDQEKMFLEFSAKLPWNHYCRKNIGYLHALERGAELIYETDDDNFIKPNWQVPVLDEFECGVLERQGGGFVNIYNEFSDAFVWPRGLPLKNIKLSPELQRHRQNVTVGIWQYLADGDPDVDAIYRLTKGDPVTFDNGDLLALPNKTFSPFNSQNTFTRRELAVLLYLPVTVTFRFTDILRGYVAQAVLESTPYCLAFGEATVFQERNDHDFLVDFESEIPVYRFKEEDMFSLVEAISGSQDVFERFELAYAYLFENDWVGEEELQLVASWVACVQQLLGD